MYIMLELHYFTYHSFSRGSMYKLRQQFYQMAVDQYMQTHNDTNAIMNNDIECNVDSDNIIQTPNFFPPKHGRTAFHYIYKNPKYNTHHTTPPQKAKITYALVETKRSLGYRIIFGWGVGGRQQRMPSDPSQSPQPPPKQNPTRSKLLGSQEN